jgi:hypothetical protein
MTWFLNLRTNTVGGEVRDAPQVLQTDPAASASTVAALTQAATGRDLVFVAHGFNVNQADGIAHLSNWEKLLTLDPNSLFVGILWPGDSSWLGALVYPGEGRDAMKAGDEVADFIDTQLAGAASISFVSHSLGTRLVLEAILKTGRDVVKQIALMAGAINDDCLVNEYAQAAAKVEKVSILASLEDEVLAKAYPLGNLAEGIIDVGHPYWKAALGHRGPSSVPAGKIAGNWEIPDGWQYGHHHYLELDPPPNPVAIPQDVPKPDTVPPPQPPAPGDAWQPGWSAALVSTRFR